MRKSDFVIVTARKLTGPEWQGAINSQDYIVRLVLDQSRMSVGTGIVHGDLGGEPVSFPCEELELSSLFVERRRVESARFAFATSGDGDLKPSAAGGMALWAYASAAGGHIVDPVDQRIIGLEAIPFRHHLDGLLAVAFDRDREYYERYPQDRRDMAGPRVAVARLTD